MQITSVDFTAVLIFWAIEILVLWLIIFSAVRVAIGPLRTGMTPPSFVASVVAGEERPVVALTNRGGTAAFRIRAAWHGQLPEPGVEVGFANPGDTIEWTAPARPASRPDAGPQLLAVWWIVPAANQERRGSEYVPVYLPPLERTPDA